MNGRYLTLAELKKLNCVYCGKTLSEGGRITYMGGKPAHLSCLPAKGADKPLPLKREEGSSGG